MDNRQVAQVFGEIADLLEIKGDNAFKIRAYRTAADTMARGPMRSSRHGRGALRELPGIGKDLAAKIRELDPTPARAAIHQELLQEFPPTILDMLRLQGVGPKTVALLYSELNIRSLEELAAAARSGRLRELKGMGAKKEALILKAIEERQKDAGRHLLSDTSSASAELVAISVSARRQSSSSQSAACDAAARPAATSTFSPSAASASLMDVFVAHPNVDRILGQGATKSSVLLCWRLPGRPPARAG